MATFCALGAGELTVAAEMARRQGDLPFVADQRDLAEEETVGLAALTGDWAAVVEVGERFLRDWSAAGRPPAPGRGLAPASVAFAHAMLDDAVSHGHWLVVLADIRGVAREAAWRGTGYGELYEALRLLHLGLPAEAQAVLAPPGDRGMYGHVFHGWTDAVADLAAGKPVATPIGELVRDLL